MPPVRSRWRSVPASAATLLGVSLLTSPLLRTSQLRARGLSSSEMQRAVEEGRLWRVVRGWYAEPGTDPELIRAMRLGGRLGCVSALRVLGGWCPPDAGMHVAMPFSASGRRLREELLGASDAVTVHWHAKTDQQSWEIGMSTLRTAVTHAVECQPRHFAVAVLDSLLHRRVASTQLISEVLAALPERYRNLASQLDARSEEGIESIARYRPAEAGIVAEPQVVVPRVGRVDLLIDGWLVVELDGRETHAQQEAFSRDRRRAALLHQHGYTVLHFSYAHVVYDWPLVLHTVLAVLRRAT